MILEEKILRKYIRNSIQKIKMMQEQQVQEERRMRNVIRKLIRGDIAHRYVEKEIED